MELRKEETDQILSALQSQKSLLVIGAQGSGKSHLGESVAAQLKGFRVAIANYSGAAKETLLKIADQLGVDPMTGGEKPKPMTAQQLREELLLSLKRPKTILIADDAHRWSSSLRYWLEDCYREGVLLLLLASSPPSKDIFLKLPIVELKPLTPDQIRDVMQREAIAQGMTLTSAQFAELQTRAGGNLALAKRVVYEELLGISETRTPDEQHQYVDGTPFLVTLIALIGVVRFVGLGLGDKALYVLGGLLTLAALALRSILYAANRDKRQL